MPRWKSYKVCFIAFFGNRGYRTLNQYTPLPIIVYNVPGRTAVNMLADTTLQLARDCEHIIGIKEASGDMVQCMQLVQNRPEGFLLLSGDDNLALAQMAIGFDGVISVAANAYARAFSTMIRQAADGNIQQARTLHYEWLPGIDLLFSEGNPAGIKCALHLMGYCGNHLRLPLVPVSAHMSQALAQFLHKHHLIALS